MIHLCSRTGDDTYFELPEDDGYDDSVGSAGYGDRYDDGYDSYDDGYDTFQEDYDEPRGGPS